MKITTYNMYKYMSHTVSIWWLLVPEFRKRWMGKIIYIGLRGWGLCFDFRRINNIKDFAEALINPK